jgi:hypothetical protein
MYFENVEYIMEEGIRRRLEWKNRRLEFRGETECSVVLSPCLWVERLSAEPLGSFALFVLEWVP